MCEHDQDKSRGLPIWHVEDYLYLLRRRQEVGDVLDLSKQEYNLRLPGDVALDETVRKMDFYHFKYGKFLLALIEESLTKSRPDLQDKHLQVEHIMPQTLTHQWREQIGPEGVANHSQDVHNIGNLTLIRHNQELGQKTFAEKKACYENHAGLQIATSRIVDQEKWTSEAIHKRADWLIERLTQDVLPIPESSSDEEQALSLGDLVADAQWPQSKQLVWLLRKAGLDRVHRICRAHGIYGAPKYGQLLVDKTSRVPENQHVAVFREDGIDYYIYTNQNGPKKEQLLAAIEPHL